MRWVKRIYLYPFLHKIPSTTSRYRDITLSKGGDLMPVLSRFYGIIIRMYFLQKEHNPPHIHATYSGYKATFSILDGSLLAGKFPPRAQQLVCEFIFHYKNELQDIWDTQDFRELPPIE